MAEGYIVERPQYYCIAVHCICLCYIAINLYILSKEIRHRRRNKPKFKSRLQKWLSLLSITGGLVHSTSHLLSYVNGFCFFMFSITILTYINTPICVGLYQLNRLYQCFAEKSLNGGYPKCLFYLMATFGVLYFVSFIPYVIANDQVLQCGLTSNYAYYAVNKTGWVDTMAAPWIAVCNGVYLMWDLTTFFLFVCKLRTFTVGKSADPESPHKIKMVMGIRRYMTRIVILTIFSWFLTALTTIIDFHYSDYSPVIGWSNYLYIVLYIGRTTVLSYCVFLMEPHNSEDYGIFLKRLISLKLHHCCCCFRDAVKDQRNYFLPPKYEAVYKVTASGMELENEFVTPLIAKEELIEETGTAFNDFSMIELPSMKYQAPSPMTTLKTPNPEEMIMYNMDTTDSPRVFLFGEHQLGTVSEELQIGTPSPDVLRTPTASRMITPSLNVDDRDQDAMHQSLTTSKPVNDFLFETSDKEKQQFSSGFSFGVYLEYWRKNKRNSVRPKYKTLKQELTMNRHATITEEEYEKLRNAAIELLNSKKYTFSAKHIGTMNRVCRIKAGSKMTVDHVICMKLYTDFTDQQTVFKRHCRRLYKDEPIQSVMRRNREIAHWCRLLRECIMFYGESMSASDVVYCGLNAHLIFRSLNARFECPLSTTKARSVAQQFSEGDQGIILMLKRANPNTRYLNVRPFTVFKNEDERLFSGSTLKIVDILVKMKSLKRYINALQMLEEIVNGYFITNGPRTAETVELLLSFMLRVMEPSVMDVVEESTMWGTVRYDLEEDGYDTDAVLVDIENENDSNIMVMVNGFGDGALLAELIKVSHGNLLDVESIPKYVWFLFLNFLQEMTLMMERGTLWINQSELDREEFGSIEAALFRDGKLFDVLSIDKARIPRVQQYQWMIAGKFFNDLKGSPVSGYITSPQFVYDVISESDHHQITFHFRFYRQYSEEEAQCAIFLEIDEIPDEVKRVRIEVDMKCHKKMKFRQLLRTRILSKEQRTAGFLTFKPKEVERNKAMQWVFGVKVFNVEKHEMDEEDGHLREIYQLFE